MEQPTAEDFFNLSKFAHAILWKPGAPVWSPLLSLETYFRTIRFEKKIKIPKHVHLEQPEQISIGAGTIIEPGVLIQGPCIIGEGCILRQGAYIRSHTILGNQCVIGHAAEIKQSILLDRAAATHFVYVGDSILGNEVNLGAGVKCANLRLDRKEVRVVWNGATRNTGLKKFGAIVGDQAQIGCNSVLNPGTLVGKQSACHPLMTVSGTISDGCIVTSHGVEQSGKKLLEKLGRR